MTETAKFSTPQQFAANAAQKLLKAGMNVNALRTNGLLRKEEWVELDREVVSIARARLIGIADLQALGLTQPLGGLGTLISQYEAESDMTPANIDMSGVARGEEDDQEFDLRSVPIPIVHKDFRINIRRLEASRRLGDSIDTTQAGTASRRVSDGLEGMLFRGAGVTVQGNTIYGYTSHPDRNTGTAVGVWSTIANIYPTVLDMVKKAHADHMYGPYMLYVAGDVWPDLLAVHDDGSGQTALDRVKRIPNLRDVKAADELPDGNLVLVQMTKSVVDLAIAQDIATVEWQTEGGMVTNFKVMAAMAPRLKSDYDGRCGIVHYTGA
ncbi:hypothetical protein FE783_12700 [Paenibacillus mesophilus]|uniref:major capsid protein n=1 Tax=Paenibacillus mesophilus TaxID=2582849 RepID=UPI00110DEA2D|nr:family 1 encapsulin nanocompartment shell protein [Paenibacillus mesophilus]TMV49369.1 hypothetical protein FE783_12700 [Paenibacillus mesophilus]